MELGGLRPRMFSNGMYKSRRRSWVDYVLKCFRIWFQVKLGGLRLRVFSNVGCINHVIEVEWVTSSSVFE